jgi:hypothetical protein
MFPLEIARKKSQKHKVSIEAPSNSLFDYGKRDWTSYCQRELYQAKTIIDYILGIGEERTIVMQKEVGESL